MSDQPTEGEEETPPGGFRLRRELGDDNSETENEA